MRRIHILSLAAALMLIPQGAVAFACAAAIVLGFGIYNGVFFAAFAPGLAAFSLFFTA